MRLLAGHAGFPPRHPRQPLKTSDKIGIGCLVLFLLPFCAVGVGTAVNAVRSILAGEWGQAGVSTVVALIFGGAGFGLLLAVRKGLERHRATEWLKQQHPNEPWLWRPDWAAGRIESSLRARMLTVGAFSIFWNLIAFAVACAVISQAVDEGNKTALLVLAFPAIGLGLLAWAIRLALRHRRYGVSVLRLATVPEVIGRLLRGTIVTNAPVRLRDAFHVTLTCLNRHSDSGSDDTSEKVLWQEEHAVERVHHEGGATVIPVSFRLPGDLRESGEHDEHDYIIWRLEVYASVPGVDYTARFEVPVFRTPDSGRPLTPEEERSLPMSEGEFRQPPESRILVRESLRRTEIYFPAARNVGIAAGVTVFFIMWTALVYALPKLGAPIVFPILFGLFDLLLGHAVVASWLLTTHIVSEPSAIWVRSGVLGFGRIRHVPVEEIDDIVLKIGMQAGNRPYYDIKIMTDNGKKVNAGSAIRDKREAEWLIERMWRGLDVEP
jgi:hypothetical protein